MAVAQPEIISQVLPRYPEAALEHGISCATRILYHVETDGTATLIRIQWDVPPPEFSVEAFESSIRGAVGSWRFKPAYQLIFTGRSEGALYEERLVPYAAHAIVRFRVENGNPVVD